MPAQNEPKIKTTRTVFTIIERIQEMGGAGVTEIADSLGMSKSTVHRHLATLEDMEYVVKDGDQYRISLKFLDHAYHAKQELELTDSVGPLLEQLAEETDEVAWLSVPEHDKMVGVEFEAGEHGIQTLDRVGLRTPMHINGVGKAVLAHLDRDRVDEIIDRYGLPPATEQTITDREELYEELDRIRERGYAYNDRESVAQLRGVAAPILVEGKPVAAVTVIGPSKRLTGSRFREELPELVLGTANAIELELTHR